MAVKPSIPKGTRDFTPEQVAKRNYIFNTIRTVFEKYGYQPIETPTMENLSTLEGKYGDEGDKLMYKIRSNKNLFTSHTNAAQQIKDILKQTTEFDYTFLPHKSNKALRFDLTVPFARYVVMHQNEIIFPFKRYQIQPVFRGERPQKSRYCEFYQCDADVVGSNSLLNEIELIQIYDEVFKTLKMPITIKINNRKILQGLAEIINAPDRMIDIAIAIDKLDKIGTDGVNQELLRKGFNESQTEKLLALIETDDNFPLQDTTDKLLELINLNFLKNGVDYNDFAILKKGKDELQFIFNTLKKPLLSHNTNLVFDISLARGLNYYTGAIIEVKANGVQIGSIGGGGRYDDLTGIFGLKGVSGVGISFGADRIYDVMEELKLFREITITSTKVLFVNFDTASAEYILPLLWQIRNAGISSELYPSNDNMKKQMSYADDKKIPFVVLAGENEIKEGKLTLKNMVSGEQEKLTIEEIISKLK